MELNKRIDKTLTNEQKAKFQRDNGKFRLLNNIVILPIIFTLVGIYLDSAMIVGISITLIVAFLLLKVFHFSKKNVIYDDIIIPITLMEDFDFVEHIKKDSNIDEMFEKSRFVPDYHKIKADKSYIIQKDKYDINFSKVVVDKMYLVDNDEVTDKDIEEKINGVFAYVKLPRNTNVKFKVVDKRLYEGEEVNLEDKIKIISSEFDSVYNVFSKTPIETRGVLTYPAMARIIDFNNSIGKIINFTINEDMLYIAIDYDKFLEFKGEKKKYVNDVKVAENLKLMEVMDTFINYIVNMFER